MLNDTGDDEFDNQIEDEDGSIYPPPGVEIGTLPLQPDRGSGSYAEDGQLEVAEDRVMMDGEAQVGSAAMYGPTEIGEGAAESGQSEIGQYAEDGSSEIGDWAAEEGQSEIGDGPASEDGSSEIGDWAPEDQVGAGQAALEGSSEIGSGLASEDGQSEIGAAHAVAKVVEKARDNRQPPPPMKAVDVDDEWPNTWLDEAVSDVIFGCAEMVGANDPFPLTTQLMNRCRAGAEPRIVRIDTEESYKQFRQDSSPELAELKARLEAHIADPHAHEQDELSEDIEDLVVLGEEVQEAEKEKEVELWMPKHFDGGVTAWREGDFVCSSMVLPTGQVTTTLEPVDKCVDEMSRHAAESGVPASSVVGCLHAMGCVLGAGTGLKEMAAAAKSLAKKHGPCVVRIEPKVSPALCALAMLAFAAKDGVPGAADEWANLAALSPVPVKQAMLEAAAIAKKAA